MLALLGAAGWAAYILLNRQVGRRLPGLQAPAAPSLVSIVVMTPLLVALLVTLRPGWQAVAFAVLAGVLSNLLPSALDLIALRTIPAQTFRVLVSVQPAFAALSGLTLLGQQLDVHEWVGITIVAATNAVTVATHPAEAPVVETVATVKD